MKRNNLTLLASGFLALAFTACMPKQKDPDFNFDNTRLDANVDGLVLDAENPLAKIGAPALWKRTTGKNNDGSRVRIAIVGTGVDYTNPDLRDALWINSGESGESTRANQQDDDGNGYPDDVFGYDFYSGDNMPYDWHGHDTFIASIIAATGKSNKKVVGVAPNAELLIARYIGPDGQADALDAVEALEYAISNNVKIIYFNWPQGGFDPMVAPTLLATLKRASEKNILIVTPAGNTGNQNVPDFIKEVAKLPNAVVVAGLDKEGRIRTESNSGKLWVTTAAPAENAVGFLAGSPYVESSDLKTTSVATAYVTGAAALLATIPTLSSAERIRGELLERAVSRSDDNPLDVLSDGPLSLAAVK